MYQERLKRTAGWKAFLPVLAAAFVVRLVLAAMTQGYTYDMSCFISWGERLLTQGPAAFYSADYFADYPPGYLPVLALVAGVRQLLGVAGDSALGRVLLAVVPSLCDCAIAALVYAEALRGVKDTAQARLMGIFTAFCPALLFATGVWKQVDAAFILPLLGCFLLLERRRYLPAAFLYGIALTIKPQALLAGPVLALCFVLGVADAAGQGKNALARAVGRLFGGAALALAVPLAAGLPFYGPVRLIPALVEKYLSTASGYPYATINAFNWFAALGGNWTPLEDPVVGPVTWGMLGIFNIAVITVAVLALGGAAWMADRKSLREKRRFSPLLLAGVYMAGVFTFGHCMHERYLLPGVLLVLLAAARWNDLRLYGAAFGLSLTAFLNLAAVYTQVGTEDEWLTSATSRLFTQLVSFAETAAFVLLAFTAWTLCRYGLTSPMGPRMGRVGDRSLRFSRAAQKISLPDTQPRWSRREALALLGLTAATAVLSFTYLGSLTAPQNPLDATDRTETQTVTLQGDAAELWIYPGISTGGSLTVTLDGMNLYTQELGYSTVFSWESVSMQVPAGTTLQITVNNAQIFELALRAADGSLVPVEGGGALFDEQAAVPDTISQLNSM